MDSIRECSVEGCPSRPSARGYCNSHYARWKRYGSPDGKPAHKPARACGVDGCERPQRNWGYCNMHGQRFYHHGDPLVSLVRVRKQCSVDGCASLTKGHGLCEKHLRRAKNNGSPLVVRDGGRPLVGENPGWAAIHKRVRRSRGKAAEHLCIGCGETAAEWSYSNRDANELIDPVSNIAYSLSIGHYEPRCIPCHRAFDASHRRNKLTLDHNTKEGNL